MIRRLLGRLKKIRSARGKMAIRASHVSSPVDVRFFITLFAPVKDCMTGSSLTPLKKALATPITSFGNLKGQPFVWWKRGLWIALWVG
jgi:hypothetical protein